ncbi:sialidase family protein [Bifidobacterium sp. SO4]|uniref:sialidase family protein n=1 Tax=Bifidobacterium sp. SO4 TaxID=2809030 RepID=UPI001BDCA043|nr:sialidase family protein [Bifidobacterium sp. SO4]MBT1170627.1 ricin-type beta-trefoil lectin domain protein [Bifidobacterium sp. SO4]
MGQPTKPKLCVALLCAAVLSYPAAIVSGQEPAGVSLEASMTGTVLYAPDLTAFPKGTAGYPRAIRLINGDGNAILATFAQAGHGKPGSMPVYRSEDEGRTWNKISTVTSHTEGWDIEAPTLYEVTTDSGVLKTGDILAAGTAWKIGDYTSQAVEVFKSRDGGYTWDYLSNCTQTSGMPNTWGHGIWEPAFRQSADGTLACFISDERPAGSPTNNQIIGHYTSSDGGLTWSDDIIQDVAFANDNLKRPGMQTFADLPDGRVVMSYEMCRDATDANHACEVYIKYSNNGLDWGDPSDAGILVQTSDSRELLHTPYIAWTPTGGKNGTLMLSGQRIVAGPTGNKTILEESGTVMFANTHLGVGEWFEISTPIRVSPTGGYANGEQSCAGYSTPMIPLADGQRFLYLAATWLNVGNQCQVNFAQGELPENVGTIISTTGQCLDVDTNTARNGNAAQLWTCNIASGQRWSIHADGSIRSFGKCLDVDAQGTENFTKVQLWECNGSGAQQWLYQTETGALVNPQSGKCLDIPAGKTDDGTQLQIYECNGLWTQHWTLPS